jgi:hypothetical protein
MLSKRLNRSALGIALILLVGLVTPTLSLAAGSTPNAPLAISTQSRTLEVGGQDWYAFTTAGMDSNNDPSHVLIVLSPDPDGSATFKVWSAEGLKQKATEDSTHPIYALGEGTKLEYQDGSKTLDRYGGDLVWNGGFNVGGTFYVQVGQTGPTPSNYRLTITGDNISFPPSAGQGQSAQATSAAVTNSAIPAADVPGSSLGTAMTPHGQMVTINPGGQQWYAVKLGRPAKDEDKQNLNVELVAPAGGAGFNVWTAERLAERATSDDPNTKAPPIGQGTVSSYQDGSQTVNRDNGYLTWSGDASYGGTFYIVVNSTSAAPIQYTLKTSVSQR